MWIYTCLMKCCAPIPQRYVVATAVLSAIAVQYFHRLAFNLTITEITYRLKVSKENLPIVCNYSDGKSKSFEESKHAEFHWSNEDQGLLLGAFYFGYIFTQIPGGYLADQYGPKRIMGYGTLISAILSLVTPLSARLHKYVLVGVRVALGLVQGPMFPAQSVFLARWSLPKERNSMNSYMNIGIVVGAVMSNFCSGLLLHYLEDWDTLYYFLFGITLVWYIFWTLFAYDDLSIHPFMIEKEIKELHEALRHTTSNFDIKIQNSLQKYFEILKSVPVWAMVAGNAGQDWAFYVIVTLLPEYLAYVLLYDISENGLINCLPYISMLIFQIFFAKLADCLVNRGWMSKTAQCKLFTFIANEGACVCFITASYSGCFRGVVVTLFTLAMGFMGIVYACVRVVNVDMAPNFAGFLMALMNGVGSLCGFFGPPVFSIFTDQHTVENWRGAFILSSALITVVTVIFCIWGTSEIQSWNFSETEPNKYVAEETEGTSEQMEIENVQQKNT